jgi:hypothetical protein
MEVRFAPNADAGSSPGNVPSSGYSEQPRANEPRRSDLFRGCDGASKRYNLGIACQFGLIHMLDLFQIVDKVSFWIAKKEEPRGDRMAWQ